MNDKPPPKPSSLREDRLKAALKANLQRRKTQARAKAAKQEGAQAQNEKE